MGLDKNTRMLMNLFEVDLEGDTCLERFDNLSFDIDNAIEADMTAEVICALQASLVLYHSMYKLTEKQLELAEKALTGRSN